MIQDPTTGVILYRPLFVSPGGWFAYVSIDSEDADKPVWARRSSYKPVTEAQAVEWFERNGLQPPGLFFRRLY